jgi:pSer/pThr/pTyr-binding forkhead associated (FHA) protein
VFVAGLTEFTVTKIDVNDIEITLTGGPAAGQTLQITKAGATIGRSTDNVCVVTDRELSRKHCSVEYDGMEACFFLCDIGSTNGTYVRMQGPYSGRLGLGLGDHIMIGRTAFSVNR